MGSMTTTTRPAAQWSLVCERERVCECVCVRRRLYIEGEGGGGIPEGAEEPHVVGAV